MAAEKSIITPENLEDKGFLAEFCKLPEIKREMQIVAFTKNNKGFKRKVIDNIIAAYEKEYCPKIEEPEEEALDSKIARTMLSIYQLRTIQESGDILKFENGGWIKFSKLQIGVVAQSIGGREDVTNKICDEVYGKLLRENLVSMEDTERRPDLFMDGSGKVFSTTKRQFEDISNQKNVLVIHKIPALFNPNAEIPKEFLDTIELIIPSPTERDTFQEHIGSGFYREMLYDKAVVLKGPTRNGKTTLLQCIEEVAGKNNISSLSLQDTAKNFRLYNMLGKLFNFNDELTANTMKDASLFKAILGGKALTVERKYEQPFDAKFYVKPVFGCNVLPPAPDKSDDGYYSKIIILNTPNIFLLPEQIKSRLQEGEYNANPNLVRDITSDPEKLSGILNWCLDGLERLNRQGGYSLRLTLEESKVRYDALAAPSGMINDFLISVCNQTDSSKMVYKLDVFELYKLYCISRKIPEPTMQEFNKRLQAAGYDPKFRSAALSETLPLLTKPTDNPYALKGLVFKDTRKTTMVGFEAVSVNT